MVVLQVAISLLLPNDLIDGFLPVGLKPDIILLDLVENIDQLDVLHDRNRIQAMLFVLRYYIIDKNLFELVRARSFQAILQR